MELRSGDEIAGKYRIVSRLGGGNMGSVYEAEHIHMPKRFAIKVLHSDVAMKETNVERFRREAEAACALDHLNICAAVDFGSLPSGDLYFVMEMLNGETLTHRLKTVGRLAPLDACVIMRQLLSALQCASAHGVVHRDVKPDNMMLTARNGISNIVKLFDFGIAHVDAVPGQNGNTLTHAGEIYGTPQYMSPEQIIGDGEIDTRADLYAAGCVFYEMLAGETVFSGANYVELFHRQLSDAPPHLDASVAQSEALDAIIQKLLRKSPADRYQTADAVIADLDKVIVALSGNPLEIATSAIGGLLVAAAPQSDILNAAPDGGQTGAGGEPAGAAASGGMSISEEIKSLIPQDIKADVRAAIPKTKSARRGLIIIVIVCVIIVLLVIALALAFNKAVSGRSGAPAESIDGNTGTVIYEAKKTPKSKPQPYNYEEKYKISYDSELSKDQNIVSAAENLLAGNYEQALVSLQAVKSAYISHPNFKRLYLVALFSIKDGDRDYDELYAVLDDLIQAVPDAAKNPSVRDIIFDLMNTRSQYKRMSEFLQTRVSCAEVARLIIESPFDRYEIRKERLLDVYGAMDNSDVPRWLKTGADIWRTPVTACRQRLEIIQAYGEADREFFDNVLSKLDKMKKCYYSKYLRKDCHGCLRDLIDKEKSRFAPKTDGNEGNAGNDGEDGEDA